MGRDVSESVSIDRRKRWWAMNALSCGSLMIAIDATVVNVALPAIGRDLHFFGATLVWPVNTYLCTFGGFLLIAGRLGDLLGHRRVFMAGIATFTAASLACGLANSAWLLIGSRLLQGFAGAAVTSVAFSLILRLFPDMPERVRALGVFAFIGSVGGSAGLLLGGVLTGFLSWRWIFLVNIPLGIAVGALSQALVPRDPIERPQINMDWLGAVALTALLTLVNYQLVDAEHTEWFSTKSLLLTGMAGIVLMLFVRSEMGSRTPILPTALFRARNFVFGNIAGILLAGAILSWAFVASLYLQRVLHLTPMQVGLAFLPMTLLDAILSIALVPPLVARLGLKPLVVAGMLMLSVGVILFARITPAGRFINESVTSVCLMWGVVPPMSLLGIGTAMTYNPLYLCATSAISSDNFGTVSGAVNSLWTLGGALGLALIAGLATAHTDRLLATGTDVPLAQSGGYQWSFYAAAVALIVAAAISGVFIRGDSTTLAPKAV